MRYLIDTSALSLVLRRQPADLNPAERQHVRRIKHLLMESQAGIIGPIAQEILTGISFSAMFVRVAGELDFVRKVPLVDSDYLEAAKCANSCSAKGIAADPIDILICAVALRLDVTVITADQDFELYEKALAVRKDLLSPPR